MNHDLKAGAEPISGYTLIEPLGRGGFGEVWKANGPGGFQVALKFVALAGNVGAVELRALEVIKKIRHPHLLANFGSWQEGGRLIIAMELADKTLLDRFREAVGQGFAGIPAPEIFEHFLDAAKALDYLNEPRHPAGGDGPQGIQHRDVKPQNLLLLGGSVKVADFGLARVLEHSETGHTGSMTPSYAAPEFFDRKTSSQSDQYSLAITYCHLRGGRLPFEGNPAAVMAGHLMREPDLSMIPQAERPAVARALAKPPRDRWPSCRAFIQAVMEAAGDVHASTNLTTRDAPRPSTPRKLKESKPNPGIGADLDIELETRPSPRPPRKGSIYLLGAWALVPAALLVSAMLVFPRQKPLEAVASRTTGIESPDTKSTSIPGRPVEEVTRLAPPIAPRPPIEEVIKPDPPIAINPPGDEPTKPKNPVLAKPEKKSMVIRDLVAKGLSSLAAEATEKAMGNFNEAIRLDPGNSEAFAGRAYAFILARDRRRGSDDAEKAIQLDPKSAVGHAVRGFFLSTALPHDFGGALDE